MKSYVKIAIGIIFLTIIVSVITTVPGFPINTNNAWIGYWGSIFGGFMTLVGVKITLDENKKTEENSKNQMVLPVFASCKTRLELDDLNDIDNDTNVYCIYDTAKGTVAPGNPFKYSVNGELKDASPTLEEFKSNFIAFRYKITNIGCGSALKISISAGSMRSEKYIGMQVGDSYEIVLLLKSERGNEMHEKIQINFENVYGKEYSQEEFLHYQKIEDCIVNIREGGQQKGLSGVKEE